MNTGKWFNKKTVGTLAAIGVLLVFAVYILPVSLPLLVALVTAFLLEPPVAWACRRFKWPRKPSVIAVFILFLLFITAVLYFTVTQLIGQLIQLSKTAPVYMDSLSETWLNIESFFFRAAEGLPEEVVAVFEEEFAGFLVSVRESVLTFVNYDTVTGLLTGIPGFLVSFLVFLIALFLFMLELPNLKMLFFRQLKDETADKVRFMLARMHRTIFGFMKAQFLVSLVIFAASLIGLFIVIPEYAIVMSLVIWVIDLIPILGSILILAPWSAYQFVAGNTVLGIELSILAFVLLLIRRTMEPKVMGTYIGLSPLATLISMFLGLKLFGLLGFIIGPLIVILYTSARDAEMIKWRFKI
ncbi:sporulation integral membrane protein YtvI [Indiicoccus explosivorum]|uniref:sporulation integral membrane protein YtvI n=1 Tax=Indiicoccus explosivorum TaxID=1917864 RepID=UPI000B4413DA|nr:sporulation integral membrane protein YtvI [Indiicoccus explosivorum]